MPGLPLLFTLQPYLPPLPLPYCPLASWNFPALPLMLPRANSQRSQIGCYPGSYLAS